MSVFNRFVGKILLDYPRRDGEGFHFGVVCSFAMYSIKSTHNLRIIYRNK